MALTYTPEPEIGTPLPPFRLTSVQGKDFESDDFKTARVKVFMFICNHCPYVQAIEDRIVDLAHSYSPDKVAFVGVCSNDPTDYPEDNVDSLRQKWAKKNFGFPYLVDETQEVAKAFGAVCTPDFFVFDESNELKYRGRFDDSWKDASKVQKRELKTAIDQLLEGKKDVGEQVPSMGCSIKWKE